MKRARVFGVVVRGVLLLAISFVLVAGFWYHQMFYQLGLIPLLLLGGFATLVVIVVGHIAFSGKIPRRRSVGILGLTIEEGRHVALRSATLLALPCEAAADLKVGSVVSSKYFHASSELARLEIRDSYRRLIADISEEEMHALGYQSKERFRAALRKNGRLNPTDIITLTRFRVVEDET